MGKTLNQTFRQIIFINNNNNYSKYVTYKIVLQLRETALKTFTKIITCYFARKKIITRKTNECSRFMLVKIEEQYPCE